MVTTAMILAAGRGKRMGKLTDALPKPLLPVNGTPMIDHVINKLREEGIQRIVVNTHYHGEKLQAHLQHYADVVCVAEDELLDTGGGIRNALPILGDEPFITVNCDAIWTGAVLPRLVETYERQQDGTLGVLLLQPTVRVPEYTKMGDFCLTPSGVLQRRPDGYVAPFVYTGIQLLSPALFKAAPEGAFSMVQLYYAGIENGTLRGVVHDADWQPFGTYEELILANKRLAAA